MNEIWYPAVFICAAGIAALLAGLFYRLRMSRMLGRLNEMLDEAMKGNYTESVYDESMLSRFECRLGQYLSACEVSSRNLAQEKDKIKTLISDISHQTKTPVANIRLYSELLRELELDSEAGRYVELLGTQAEKLSFLISSLVKMSRLETGILALHPKAGGVSKLLLQVHGQFLPKAEEKGLSLTIEPTDAQAVFDEKWTAEALGNLVDNALKYTDQGGVSLSVKSYEQFTRIDVSDTGSGIPEMEQAKIFRRFYRSPSAGGEGVGIGLYLAREIAAGEGGYIKVDSAEGRGSVFSLYLPAGTEILQNR